MIIPQARFVLLLSVACIAGCEHRDAPGGRAADPDLAANASPAWDKSHQWTLPEHPAVAIGEEDGPAEYQLVSISAAMRLLDGTIVLCDRGTGQIHFYTKTGEHVRTVGRKGDGPGEFRGPEWMGQRADSLLVWDPFPSRLTVYASDGRLSRMATVRGVDMGWIVGMMSDGSLILSERSLRVDGPVGEHTDSVTYLRISATDGRIVGKLGPYLSGERFSARHGGMIVGDGIIFGRSA